MKKKRKTAGELSLQAARDRTRYDPLEVGHALTEDVYENLCQCADKHDKIIAEDEYFLVIIVAGDPLIRNLRRHKYCALLFLPQPRPQQTVFLYNRHTQRFRRLWSLPDAATMAVLDELPAVGKEWQATKRWVRSFYAGTFFEDIRHQHGIKHLAEREFMDLMQSKEASNLHDKKVIEPTLENCAPGLSEPFDFSKIMANEVVNS